MGAPPAAAPAAAGAAAAPLDLSDMRRFVSSPLPRSAGVLRCVVERDAAGLAKRMFPAYTLRGDGAWAGGSGGGGGRALLAARKRTASVTANYVISLDARDLGRGSPATVGKVRANYLGTEFTVFDDGVAPGKADGGGGACRRELAAVLFTSNVLSSRGPRKMRAAVPRLSADDTPAVVLQPARDADGMAERMQDAARAGDLLLMVNREPSWNDDLGAYVLNFDGRVTQPSVKNFQLVEAAGGAAAGAAGGAGLPRVLLLFGRVDRDRFTLDFQGPLSPLQAFAIALTSLDYKLGCE